MILASTFYMLSTIEGPIQAIKSVNAIAHFTDWIPRTCFMMEGSLGWGWELWIMGILLNP